MNQRDAGRAGFDAGYGIGSTMTGEPDFNMTDREEFIAEVLEAEENARQMSPFEFLAVELNQDEARAEGLWASYDAGVYSGALAAWRELFGSDRKKTRRAIYGPEEAEE